MDRISVCIPASNEADGLAGMLPPLVELRERGEVIEVGVVDDASPDGTAALARELGASVHQRGDLLAVHGPPLGKGDAIWRGLSVLEGEIAVFLDADLEGFDAGVVAKLTAPLISSRELQLVKGGFARPFRVGDASLPAEGGRVTELMARPLLRSFYPELAQLRQPLSGQMAARSELLRSLPITADYGVEIGLLIDTWHAVGMRGIAEVDLGELRTSHQPLAKLGAMADEVLAAVVTRLVAEGRMERPPGMETPVQRPPLVAPPVAAHLL